MFIALKRTMEHREGGERGALQYRTVDETSTVLKIAEMVGEHCHGISWRKCAIY